MIKANIVKTSNVAIKILIIILSFWFIFYHLFLKYDSRVFINSFKSLIMQPSMLVVLLIVVVMMLLNWSLETLKWQYLIKKIEKVSFFRAFSAVWAGLTIGSFTPNRTGEYFGRVFILEKANRWEGTFITFTGSISQLLVTLLVGTVSFLIFIISENPAMNLPANPLYLILAIAAIVATVFVALLYFRISWLKTFIRKLVPKKYELFRSHLEVFSYYSVKDMMTVLAFSFARYAVFTLQYFLLLRLCNIPIPFFEGVMLISCIFLIMTVIPTVALTELGVRGSVSIFILENYFSNNTAIFQSIASSAFISSGLIWMINLIIPALIGSIFVFRLKFLRK